MRTWLKTATAAILLLAMATPLMAQEVVVLSGLEETIAWFEKQDFWGENKHAEQRKVPRAMIMAISKHWQENANKLPVATKKEIFYRFMVPLVLHANAMVRDRRERLSQMKQAVKQNSRLTKEEMNWLGKAAVTLRLPTADRLKQDTDSATLTKTIDEALCKLDEIPAGLALGQAAYESGYGTSRFAVEGNALFGQWDFGGKGMTPRNQRHELGDHRIASFEWPFESVRGYFLNLNTHPAYADFRRIRARFKAKGQKPSSLELADGLRNYSERGQKYVNTLKGIIRRNNLQIADDAVFKDAPMRFVMGAPDAAAAKKLRKDIEDMRKSGELGKVIARMRLE